MKGRIHKIAGNTHEVHADGHLYACKFRGKAKRERTRMLKLAAVGDDVEFTPSGAGEGIIEKVLPRRTKLCRRDPMKPEYEHVIAANIDRIVIVQSAANPDLDLLTLDKCTVMAEATDVPAGLCVNKMDLAGPEVRPQIESYRKIGMEAVFTSAKTGEGVEDLRRLIRGKTCVLMGPSGVGKSSLLNRLMPGRDIKTRDVSARTGEGRHTTTTVEFLEAEPGTLVADTPGLEFFTSWGVTPENLAEQFPEFLQRMPGCKFRNCSHTKEPQCAILAALAAGEVSRSRHENYLRIRDDLFSHRAILTDKLPIK